MNCQGFFITGSDSARSPEKLKQQTETVPGAGLFLDQSDFSMIFLAIDGWKTLADDKNPTGNPGYPMGNNKIVP